jgi:hypothetical protein
VLLNVLRGSLQCKLAHGWKPWLVALAGHGGRGWWDGLRVVDWRRCAPAVAACSAASLSRGSKLAAAQEPPAAASWQGAALPAAAAGAAEAVLAAMVALRCPLACHPAHCFRADIQGHASPS